jgi:hypothetical protein
MWAVRLCRCRSQHHRMMTQMLEPGTQQRPRVVSLPGCICISGAGCQHSVHVHNIHDALLCGCSYTYRGNMMMTYHWLIIQDVNVALAAAYATSRRPAHAPHGFISGPVEDMQRVTCVFVMPRWLQCNESFKVSTVCSRECKGCDTGKDCMVWRRSRYNNRSLDTATDLATWWLCTGLIITSPNQATAMMA